VAPGLEQAAKSPEKPALDKTSGAFSGAFPAGFSPESAPQVPPSDVPPDLADLARRLAALPEALRADILAIVKAGCGK
jgi:hypothetical protein